MKVMATETNAAPEPTAPTAHPVAAYHPRQGPNMKHIRHGVLDQDLIAARFRRTKGDALCRTARTFWGLEPVTSSPVTCPRCKELAERYGIELIDPTEKAMH
jgi:hypothetical protein